jgi:anti-sigma28 factor (negative regulator of flagellin synthesis)
MNKLSITSEINQRGSSKQKIASKPLKNTSVFVNKEIKSDRIVLSKTYEAKALISKIEIVSDERYDLVKKFRKVIADGTYQIKSNELAEKIIQKVKESKHKIFL